MSGPNTPNGVICPLRNCRPSWTQNYPTTKQISTGMSSSSALLRAEPFGRSKAPHTDIHTDDNRDRWIIDKDRKTGTQFRVKLLPVAEMINDRYKDLHLEGNKVFPIKSYYRTMNMSLRQVARHAGLPFNPTMHMARHTFAMTVTLAQEVPLETVSKCWNINISPRPKSTPKLPMTRSAGIWRR